MLFVLLFLVFGPVVAPTPTAGDLIVTITEIEQPDAGPLTVMVWASEEGFPIDATKAKFTQKVRPDRSTVAVTFSGVEAGDYAVSVYQDRNENGAPDRNFLGMPKEPIGLTNKTKLGRPVFKKSLVSVGASGTTVSIKLLNQ